MTDPRPDEPRTVDVYRFSFEPEIDYGTVDWSGGTELNGPMKVPFDDVEAVEVRIERGVPKEAVVTYLRQVIDVLERYPQALGEYESWFDGGRSP